MSVDFKEYAERIDDWCRIMDLTWERMEGGPLGRFRVKRENFEAFLWPSLIAAAFWTGFPTLKPFQAVGILIGLIVFGWLIVVNRKCTSAVQDLAAQVASLALRSSIRTNNQLTCSCQAAPVP
jgi:hypothetical protein